MSGPKESRLAPPQRLEEAKSRLVQTADLLLDVGHRGPSPRLASEPRGVSSDLKVTSQQLLEHYPPIGWADGALFIRSSRPLEI
jgi:hypothetical protein